MQNMTKNELIIPRTDGVYTYSVFVDGINEWRTRLFRFYNDSTVITAVIAKETWEWNKSEILNWFNRQSYLSDSDKLHLLTSYHVTHKGVISFTFTSPESSLVDQFLYGFPPSREFSYSGLLKNADTIFLRNVAGVGDQCCEFYKCLVT